MSCGSDSSGKTLTASTVKASSWQHYSQLEPARTSTTVRAFFCTFRAGRQRQVVGSEYVIVHTVALHILPFYTNSVVIKLLNAGWVFLTCFPRQPHLSGRKPQPVLKFRSANSWHPTGAGGLTCLLTPNRFPPWLVHVHLKANRQHDY